MKEVHTGRPETQQPKSNVIDFEAARQRRQAEKKPQTRRPEMPPLTREDRVERDAAKRQQRIREELAHTEDKPNTSQQEQKTSPEVDELVNEILGGQSEEQIEAHNAQIKARREKEQAEKDKIREEAIRAYKKYHDRLAAMTPEEREADKKWREDMRKKFEYSQSPEGRRESVALMVRGMKDLGMLPPTLDHLWLNLPTG